MGDECGLPNDQSYKADPEKAHEGLWVHRPVMDWTCLDRERGQRIYGDLQTLQAARIASGGAGAPAAMELSEPAVLGILCGSDRVYLNFSAGTATVGGASGWRDRLSGNIIDRTLVLAPWQVVWAAPAA